MMVVASLASAQPRTISFEQPIRKRRDFWTERRLYRAAPSCSGSLARIHCNSLPEQWLSRRLPEYLLAAEEARRNDTPRDECFRKLELSQENC